MQIDDDAWHTKAQKRKIYRDRARKNFYAENGVEMLNDIQDIKGAPEKQRLLVVRLMNLTRKGSIAAENKEMCALLAKAINSNGLGKGAMGSVAETMVDLSAYEMKNIRSFFFSPAFFD